MNPLNLIPPQEKILASCIVAAVALAGAFGAGWAANGWRLHAEIADLKAERATESAKEAQDALDKLIYASEKVKQSADSAQVDISVLGAKLDAISKEQKNAKTPPLPVDCHLDDIRLRNLAAAAEAVNQAAFGLKPSATLQAAPSP